MSALPQRITLATIIVLTLCLIVGLSLYHDPQIQGVPDLPIALDKRTTPPQQTGGLVENLIAAPDRDHSFEMSSRNVRDLLERVDNENSIFTDINRLDDNNRFYFVRGSEKRNQSLRNFLGQIGYAELFDLQTVAGSRALTKPDCERFDALEKVRDSEYSASVCAYGLSSDTVTYRSDALPYSLNLYQLGETHFYFNVKTLGLTGYTLVSKLYKRDSGQVIDIDPSMIGLEVYFADNTLWFEQLSQIVYSYNVLTDRGLNRTLQTHNKSKKWWIEYSGENFKVQSFDQTKEIDLGDLPQQQSVSDPSSLRHEYFEVSDDLSKFALVSHSMCNDDWSDCFVTMLYGDFVNGGLNAAKSYEIPLRIIESMCSPSGEASFFWDGDYIVTTSGCPIRLELTVHDTNSGEMLYQHGSVKGNYISDILLAPYREKYGDQTGRVTSTSFAQIPRIVNEFCAKHPWRDGALRLRVVDSQHFTTNLDLDRLLKNGVCFSYETEEYLRHLAQDFCDQAKNYSVLAIEEYESQAEVFTKDLFEMCRTVDLYNMYAVHCAAQGEFEQDAIDNFKIVCGSNRQYNCGSVSGRVMCASFPVSSDRMPTQLSGWSAGLHPADFCYNTNLSSQIQLGWNFSKNATCEFTQEN